MCVFSFSNCQKYSSASSRSAHKIFNRHFDFISAREHSPCHIGTREHLRCRSLHRPLWVARAMPVFRQVPNKCAPSQHYFEYFALHSLEFIELVDWNAGCSQGSELMQKYLLTFIHTVALAR